MMYKCTCIYLFSEFQRKTIFLLTEIRNLLQSKSFNPACTEQPASDFTFNAVQDVEEFNALERDLEDSEFRGKLVKKKYFYISSIYPG